MKFVGKKLTRSKMQEFRCVWWDSHDSLSKGARFSSRLFSLIYFFLIVSNFTLKYCIDMHSSNMPRRFALVLE